MARNNEPKREPVKQFRSGAISVSIWASEIQGRQPGPVTLYSATTSRAYTKNDGETWDYTDSLNRDDLPIASRLQDMAFAWIVSQVTKGGE